MAPKFAGFLAAATRAALGSGAAAAEMPLRGVGVLLVDQFVDRADLVGSFAGAGSGTRATANSAAPSAAIATA